MLHLTTDTSKLDKIIEFLKGKDEIKIEKCEFRENDHNNHPRFSVSLTIQILSDPPSGLIQQKCVQNLLELLKAMYE